MDNAKTIQTILQLEQETMEGIKKKDPHSLSRILAEDFIYRTPAGSDANKDEFLNSISSLPVTVTSISGEHLKVNVYGETAVLTGIQRVTALDSNGQEETGAVAFTDIFTRQQDKWLMVLAYGVDLPVNDQGDN